MKQKELNEILRLHAMWLRGEDGGKRAILYGADLRGANLCEADLRGANLCGADLRGANLDFSCLPLWCGAKFKADDRICKQLVAHALMILQLSGCGSKSLLSEMDNYKKGWRREKEFEEEK